MNRDPTYYKELAREDFYTGIISREQITYLLKNYKGERESLRMLKETLDSDAEGYYYPDANNCSERVQNQFLKERYEDSVINKPDNERKFYQKALSDIEDMTDLLDRLIYNVNKLPGNLKLVVLSVLVDDEPIVDFAARIDKSTESVNRYKNQAIESLFHKMNRGKVGAS